MAAHDEARDPETEIARARGVLGQGDLEHALGHLAAALAFDPSHAEALQLLDDALDAAGERALSLLRVDEGTFFGVAALRARALARRGRQLEALVILFEVASYRPEIPYLAWAPAWFAPGLAWKSGGRVTAADVGARAASFVEPVRGEILQREGARRNLEGALFVLERLCARHPQTERLTYGLMLTLRRLDRHDEAIAVGRRWFESRPSWISAISLANACRDKGVVDEAIGWHRRALALRPADASPLLDIGDLLLEGGRFTEAAAAYGEVLAKRPHDTWAEPSRAFASYLATGEASFRQQVEALASRAPEGSRARALAARLGALR